MKANNTPEVIESIELSKLHPFPDHPFAVRDDDSIMRMLTGKALHSNLQAKQHDPSSINLFLTQLRSHRNKTPEISEICLQILNE